MDIWWSLLLLLGGLIFTLSTGLPVAFSFLCVNLAGVYYFWGAIGFDQLIDSIYSSVTLFALLPVPLFVIMGEVLLHSGLAFKCIEIVDKWLGRIPGRLALVTVFSATIFSTLSGSSMGTTAILGRTIVPEMERRGYKKMISIGACMSGGLAMIIPPSALAVILAAMSKVSVGKLLIAGVLPGLLMAVFYALYIIVRCLLQPSIAPAYVPSAVTLYDKLISTIKYFLPISGVIFIVIGLVFLGIATPTESAAIGALATFVLAALYRKFSLKLLKQSVAGTLGISVMMFMIMTGSMAFSQILAYSGSTAELVRLCASMDVQPIMLIIGMQIMVLILGTFMESIAIMMITLPIFMPIVRATGFDIILFNLLMLINIEVGMKSPPFGFLLFVMKSVGPAGTTMTDIIRATLPFILIDIVVMVLLMTFPNFALWLPSFMSY